MFDAVDKSKEELIEALNTAYNRIYELEAAPPPPERSDNFTNTFQHAPVMMTISAIENGKYLDVNKKFVEISGFSYEEAVGKTSIELGWISLEERDRLAAELRNNDNVHDMELVLTAKDSSTIHCVYSGVIIKMDGKDRLLSIAVDTTEHEKTLRDLRAERDKAQQYLDVTGSILIVINRDEKITLMNPAGHEILGYQDDELIGKNWFDTCIPQRDRARVRNIFHKLLNGETINLEQVEDHPVLTKMGEERYISWQNRLLKDSDGHIIGTLSSGVDVTERKTMETIQSVMLYLREYAMTHSVKDLLKATLDEIERLTHSQIGFFHFVEDDGNTIWLQMWSTNTLKNMCNAEGEGLHYPLNEAGVWVDCVREGKPVIHNDYANLPHKKGMPEGHATVIREIVVPIFRDGKIVAILGVGNKMQNYTDADLSIISRLANMTWDIIAHQKARDELQQRETLLALKDRFISTVSHEFRTPLSIIQTSSDLLKKYIDKLTPERREQSIQQITQQVKNLTALIDDVLSISRTQAGKTEFTPTVADVVAFCQTVFEEIQFIDKRNHQLDFASTIPSKNMLIDADLLRPVLVNILSNAIKYSPSGTPITLSLEDHESAFTIKIQDEGIGIPQEDLVHLFDPFHRAVNVGKVQGTGLGLSIVKEYVTLHGGTIEVTSELSKGSTFTITLPD